MVGWGGPEQLRAFRRVFRFGHSEFEQKMRGKVAECDAALEKR